jgi:hypothetical protein
MPESISSKRARKWRRPGGSVMKRSGLTASKIIMLFDYDTVP